MKKKEEEAEERSTCRKDHGGGEKMRIRTRRKKKKKKTEKSVKEKERERKVCDCACVSRFLSVRLSVCLLHRLFFYLFRVIQYFNYLSFCFIP